jgi:tetratricopeptide (TPR) repeat protein
MRARIFFSLIFVLSFSGVFADFTDSLRIKKLTDSIYGIVNNGEYEKAGELAFKLANDYSEKGNKKGEATFLRIFGYTIERLGNIDSAVIVYQNALRIAEEIRDARLTGAVSHSIGTAFYYYGKYDRALEYLLKARKVRTQIKDSLGLAWTLNNTGLIYWQQQSLDEGLYHFSEANSIFNKLNNSSKTLLALESKKGSAISYNNIGLMHENKNNHKEAKKYYLLSLRINREINNPDGIGLALNNIGATFQAEHNYDSALKYYNDSLIIHE